MCANNYHHGANVGTRARSRMRRGRTPRQKPFHIPGTLCAAQRTPVTPRRALQTSFGAMVESGHCNRGRGFGGFCMGQAPAFTHERGPPVCTTLRVRLCGQSACTLDRCPRIPTARGKTWNRHMRACVQPRQRDFAHLYLPHIWIFAHEWGTTLFGKCHYLHRKVK